MNDSSLVLTFAVPTYNRLEFLALLLESLAGQVARINSERTRMEVLVCNNASTDGTAAYLKELSDAGQVRVVEHAVNLGADANMAQCFERALGRHVWIFGDDDLPLPGVLERVVECLEREQPDLLYLPARWHAGDLKPFLDQAPEPGGIRVVDAMSLALQANAFVTFITSWIVSRRAYARIAAPADPGRHIGTSLSQLEWQLTLLAGGGKLMATDRQWLVARAGNTGGYPVFQVFSANFNRVVDDKLASHPALRTFLRDFMLRSYLPVLVWGLRRGVVGQFRDVDAGELATAIRETWPEAPAAARRLERIATWPQPLAFLAFAASRLACKIWLGWLQWRHTPGASR